MSWYHPYGNDWVSVVPSLVTFISDEASEAQSSHSRDRVPTLSGSANHFSWWLDAPTRCFLDCWQLLAVGLAGDVAAVIEDFKLSLIQITFTEAYAKVSRSNLACLKRRRLGLG